MPPPNATIAILSIGQMGLGIASLLQAHNYHVLSNVSDRSAATRARAEGAGIECVDSDVELVKRADYVLSIVPPRDAVETAKRIERALVGLKMGGGDGVKNDGSKDGEEKVLYYLDLNAISPRTANLIASSFASNAPSVRFIDGGIIGSPPSRIPGSTSQASSSTSATNNNNTSANASEEQRWKTPGIPLSGPHTLPPSATSPSLATILNTRHLNATIGSASGLKCCFAALTKGFTALALQSFSTASSLGVYAELQEYIEVYNPAGGEKARNGVLGCVGKAYRWVEEMRQIGECFGEEGGWGTGGAEGGGGGKAEADVFRGIAEVFQRLADVVEERGLEGEGMGDVEGVVNGLGGGKREK